LEERILAWQTGSGEGVAVVGSEVEGYAFDKKVVELFGFGVLREIEFWLFKSWQRQVAERVILEVRRLFVMGLTLG
jgi:hypothetical protein